MQIEKGSRVDRTLEPFQYTLLLGGYELLNITPYDLSATGIRHTYASIMLSLGNLY